jgi:hypothetical protein
VNLDPFDISDDRALLDRVRDVLRRVPKDGREPVIEDLAARLAAHPNAARVVAMLSAAPERAIRYLTMRVAIRLTPPLEASLLLVLQHALTDRQVPDVALVDLAAFLVKAVDQERNQVVAILRALIGGLAKVQAVGLLQQLEQRTGPLDEIARLRERLEGKIMVRCPRCPVQLPRPQMIKHLWLEHKLVVDGTTIREPWRLIEDWIEEYYQDRKPELLERCRMLAGKFDPEHGVKRFQRLLLARSMEDVEAKRALLEEAKQRRATVCPNCYALVFPPEEAVIRPLNVSHGRLTGGGFRVELRDTGLRTRLEIETPDGMLFQGPEPDRKLTAKGAIFYLAGPCVLLALLVAVACDYFEVPPLFPTGALLVVAAAVGVSAHILWRDDATTFDRALDHAWTMLVPKLMSQGFRKHADFLAGLALASIGAGHPSLRSDALLGLIAAAERSALNSSLSAIYLAVFWRLSIDDAARRDDDPVPVLMTQVARFFDGEFSLAFVDQLLEPAAQARASLASAAGSGMVARLRVLICDAAFEAGCEVRDLIELAAPAPALAAVLRTNEPQALAGLRLVWSQRPSVPWAKCGLSATAFELATHRDAGTKHLGKVPDLLLAAWDVPGMYISARGVLFNDVLFEEMPGTIEVRPARGGFELVLGSHAFWFADEPDAILLSLEVWLRYYFNEFRPLISEVYGWRSPGLPEKLNVRPRLECPECRQRLVVRIGDLALAAVEKWKAS